MYLLASRAGALCRMLSDESPRAFRRGAWILAAVAAGAVALFWHVGAFLQADFVWDIPLYADGAWRLARGQVPYRDFFLHLGPFPLHLPQAFGAASGGLVAALGRSSVTWGAGMALLAYALLRRRTSAAQALLFAVALLLLAAAPRPLGCDYRQTSYAMLYNRQGEVLVGLLAAGVLLAPRRPSRRLDLVDLLVLGMAAGFAFLVKISYGLAAAGVLGLGVILRALTPRRGLALAGVAVLTVAAYLALTGISFRAMLAAYDLLFRAQNPEFRTGILLRQAARHAGPALVLLALGLEGLKGAAAGAGRADALRTLAAIGGLGAGGLLLLAGNTQTGDLPLLLVAGLLAVETVRRQEVARAVWSGFAQVRYLAVAALAAGVAGVLPVQDLRAVQDAVFHKLRDHKAAATCRAPHWPDIAVFTHEGYGPPYEYLNTVQDGLDLLRRRVTPTDRLAVLAFTNPFHYALGLTPPAGGAICWAHENTFSERGHLPPERVWSGAGFVLIGRPGPRNRELWAIYGPALEQTFVLAEESAHWRLYTRRLKTP